jgi:hypothetical protein
VYFRIVSYSLARILRVVQHGLQGVVHAGFSVQSKQSFWHKFWDSLYSINCWDNRTVVRISGTEIEEHFPGLFKRILAKESPDKFV